MTAGTGAAALRSLAPVAALLTLMACAQGPTSPTGQQLTDSIRNATPPSWSLTVTVFDGAVADDRRVAGAQVKTDRDPGGPLTPPPGLTDASGVYTWPAITQMGFTVCASKTDYVPRCESVTLTSNQRLNLSLSK